VGNQDSPPSSDLLDSLWVPLIPSTPNVLPDQSTSMVALGNSDSIITQSATENVPESQDSKLAAAERKVWHEINGKASGSIQRYHEMTIKKMNNGQNGVISPPPRAKQ
jgi:hypothetical protein